MQQAGAEAGQRLDFLIQPAAAVHAAAMVVVIHAAFGARPALDPPSTASDETAASVAAAIEPYGGVYVSVAGRPAGSLIIAAGPEPGVAVFQRVSVHPDFQQHGIASAMINEAELAAAEHGFERVEIYARQELPDLIGYWRHRGFDPVRNDPHGVWMTRWLPVRRVAVDAAAMHQLGHRLAGVLRSGDLVIMSGPLGAGKTTLTQGVGAGLDSDGAIISPTFVLSRIHRSRSGRPTLVHVDAYRLGSGAELDDLGLDADLDSAITVVEWGEGLAETLADSRLEIVIERPAFHDHEHDDHEARTVWLDPVGPRWTGAERRTLITALGAGRDAVEAVSDGGEPDPAQGSAADGALSPSKGSESDPSQTAPFATPAGPVPRSAGSSRHVEGTTEAVSVASTHRDPR